MKVSTFRWRVGIIGVDRLLSDFALNDKEKREAIQRWCQSSQTEFKVDAAGKKQLAERFRKERRKLETLLDAPVEGSTQWQFAHPTYARRSARNAVPCQRLREMAAQGELAGSVADLASSYVHMHVNRLIRAAQRAHELVFYDFLSQLYDSRLARKARFESGSPEPSRLVSS